MTRRSLIVAAAVLLAGVAWYFFRPERALIDRRVSEPAPDSATVLMSGAFRSLAHEGKGTAQVLALPGGRRVLRLAPFETLDGPDLQVYLLTSPSVTDRAGLGAGFVSLGELRGNVGDQNYEIPSGADLARYSTVSIWCRRFGVNFTAAQLAAVAAAPAATTP